VEVVSDGCNDGVGGITMSAGEIVTLHLVLGLDMTDHRLDSDASLQLRRIIAVTPRFWPEM